MRTLLKNFVSENRGLLLFLALMLVFRSSIADWNVVPTGSMKPTIVEGDRILVNKLAYDLHLPFSDINLARFSEPQRGDIIVFNSQAANIRLVKRVIGVPGDLVSMDQNRVTVNGQELAYSEAEHHQEYVDMTENLLGQPHPIRVKQSWSTAASFAPILIPDGMFLVLGDNRNNSADSRYIGLVPRDEIIGRSRSVVLSFDPQNYYMPRFERALKPL